MLLLSFTAEATLKSVCDRCLKEFDNPKSVRCEYPLVEEAANEDTSGSKSLASTANRGSTCFLQVQLPWLRSTPQPGQIPLQPSEHKVFSSISRMNAVRASSPTSTRRDKRRSSVWKLKAPGLTPCPKCGAMRLSHRMCPECGTYNGRQVKSAAAED